MFSTIFVETIDYSVFGVGWLFNIFLLFNKFNLNIIIINEITFLIV